MGLFMGSGREGKLPVELGYEVFTPKAPGPDTSCRCNGTGIAWKEDITQSFDGRTPYRKSAPTRCKNPAHKPAGFRSF
ncbi:MAG: hypothetical protein AAB573_00510 [Patescibacteria group bacterium]